ncbi:MAG: type II secretion system protein [Azonexus sp.]
MARHTVPGKQSGFTYIAVMIGIAIMGAGLAAVGTVWHTMVQRDHEKELLYVGQQFRLALKRYYLAHQRYPVSLEKLVQDDGTVAVKHHLRKLYIDPMTGTTDWGIVKLPNEQIVGVYSRSEESPLKMAGFRTRDTLFEEKGKYSEWVFMADGQTAPGEAPPASQAPAPTSLQPASRFR